MLIGSSPDPAGGAADPPGPHEELAGRIAALGAATASLAAEGHADQLLAMLRRPGWTTRQEARLVSTMVTHLHGQIEGLARGHDTLLDAADQIGRD